MRADEALALAHLTMSYLRRIDDARSAAEVDAIYGEFLPWAKAHRVAPQIREHVKDKAKKVRTEKAGNRGLSERSRAMTGETA